MIPSDDRGYPEAQPGSESGLRPVSLLFDGVLDLHTFQPQDAGAVVSDYLEECGRRGIRRVRIVHGKGIGNLRRTVHAVLRRHALVEAFRPASESFGGWGATLVDLRSPVGASQPGQPT